MIRNLGQVAAIYIGSSAPRNTNLIWLDNTVVPFVFRAYDGSAWSEIATHKWVRAYVDGWLVTLPPRQLADDGDYMLINSNNVNYKITVKDFVKSAVGNPLDFKGIIRVSADFPNPSTLESGDMYVIITSPAGGTVTDPYSGKTFEDSEKIVWDEVTQSWESLGKIDITVDLTTSYSETEVTIHSSAGKETTIQGATDQLAGVMLPGQYSWLQALSNGSIVPGDPSPLTPLTPAHKHNYNDIINRLVSQQGTGESTIDPMSQKATTDALNLKFDKASVLQVSGAATDKVMSQKAVTDALKTLSDDFNNKLTNYLPLVGGTMKGRIVFSNNQGIRFKNAAGSESWDEFFLSGSNTLNIGNTNNADLIISTGNYDIKHNKAGTSYKIWDASNLPTPASTTDLTNYLPLAGGTMTGSIIFPNRKGIFGTLTNGTSNIKIAVVNANNNVEIGNSNTPLMLVSNSTDLTHYRDNNTYKIWDASNLPTPASTTDLANYLPLIGGTLTGQLTIKQSVDIKLRLQSTDADNHCIIQAINSQASQLGVFGYAGDKWAIGHGGTYYEIWDKYNLSNPVRYTLDSSGYPYFKDVNGTNFSYIKAGSSGIIPNYGASLSSEGSGTCGTSGWSFQYGYFANVCTNRIMFSNNTWTNDLTPNRNYNGYLQVLDAYDANNAGGPTNYGTVLQVNSRNAHWANQLWFPGGAEASKKGLYYRHMAYNQTTYGEWHRLLTNKDVNILSASYNNNPNSLPTNQIFYAETQGVAGTPTSSGLLFSVQGDDEGIQLWAGSNRTELYYRTKWTSFGNWIKLATTSDIGNYLPLTGGTLSGNLAINTVGSTTLVINNNDTNGSETFMRVLRKGTASAAIGFRDSLGAYIYNYNSNKYLFIDNDGYARVGTVSDSTRLALITDIPTVSGYLPLTGGTLTGALTMNSRKNNAVIDVVGGAGQSWNEGAGALSVQVPSDNGQTPLILARRSGAAIDTTTAAERLLSMELLNTGNTFRITLSNTSTFQLDLSTAKGFLFGKTIATTDQIPSIPSISISNSGSGNAVTAISASGHTLTVTKGATYLTSSSLDGYATQTWVNNKGYLTSHQTIYNLTFQAGTFAAKTFDPNGAAATVNIPTKTSHITNDSGFITSSALNGYATQSWANGQFAPLSRFNTSTGYTTIKVTGQEFNFDSANPEIYMNYRTLSGSTAVTKITWKGGSNSTLCEGRWGNLYMNDNLVATQTWSNSQYPLKTGTGASGTWGISISGNATTATTASKLGSTTIGGSAKPIYLSSGTPTACSATIGSATVPVYMNAGTITQCSTTLGVSITGNAATSTNSTQLGGTAASSYVKANDNISRLTNDSGYTTQEWVNSQNFVKSTSTKKVTDIQPVDALPATQVSGVLYLVFG